MLVLFYFTLWFYALLSSRSVLVLGIMDLSRMLSGEKTTAVVASGIHGAGTQGTGSGSGPNINGPPSNPHPMPSPSVPASAGFPSQKRARTESVNDHRTHDSVIAAAAEAASGRAENASSPYTDLQQSVHAALESKDGPGLTTSDKVALALEVLRARQLELDLAQARNNIEALVTKTGSAPRTLRSVIPASTVKGLPVGTPVEISAGKFLLSPTTNDPQALFLTLELQHFGEPQRSRETPHDIPTVQREGDHISTDEHPEGPKLLNSKGGENRTGDLQHDHSKTKCTEAVEKDDL